MTSLAGGAKAKKADEPSKKVVLKKEDVNVIVTLPGNVPKVLTISDDGIRDVKDSSREGATTESWRTHLNNKSAHPRITSIAQIKLN